MDYLNEITSNFVYFCDNITNSDQILLYLLQEEVISDDEYENIVSAKIEATKIFALLSTVQRKNWTHIKFTFHRILCQTGNQQCANLIKHTPPVMEVGEFAATPLVNIGKILLMEKWWPEKQFVPEPCYVRKGGSLEFPGKPNTCPRHIEIVGMVGIGKSTIAKCWAIENQNHYNHIIWVDCESDLLTTYERLLLDLKIDDFRGKNVAQLMALCCDKLSHFRCLWVYDNLKFYKNSGFEEIIAHNNFQFMTTSTNRRLEENGSHEFTVDVLNKWENLEFLSVLGNVLINENEKAWNHLCQLLGSLPLALKIAIDTIDKEQISVLDYIDKIKTSDYIIHQTLSENYKKSLYVSIEDQLFSLYISGIYTKDEAKEAGDIFTILGYMAPNNISIPFLQAIENKTADKIKRSLHLLSKCSLLTIDKVTDSIRIHPLVQQVSRYKEKKMEIWIIRKILNCDGFLRYKLYPFCLANRKLQKEFSYVESALIDKIDLKDLLIKEKFWEAAQLSRLHYDAKPTAVSAYNRALCLMHNYEIWEAKILFQNLYNKSFEISSGILNHPKVTENDELYFGVISSKDTLYKEIIAGHLLTICINEENAFEIHNVIKNSEAIIQCSYHLVKDITKLIRSIPNCLFLYDGRRKYAVLKINEENDSKSFEFCHCFLDDNSYCTNEDLYSLKLDSVVASSNLYKQISSDKIKQLELVNMKVDFSVELTIEQVHLERIESPNWGKAKWNIGILTLNEVHFIEANEMKITTLEVTNATVDVNVLPASIKNLYTHNSIVKTVVKRSPLSLKLKSCFNECAFVSSIFVNEEGDHMEKFDISYTLQSNSLNLQKLTLDCSDSEPSKLRCTKLSVSIDCLASIPFLFLQQCNLILKPKVSFAPKELSLKKVKIMEENEQEKNYIVVNEFVNFSNIKTLSLHSENDHVTIDFKGKFSVDEVTLKSVRVHNWKSAQWTVNKLTLCNVRVEKTDMEIKDVTIEAFGEENAVDISWLFQKHLRRVTLRNLTITHLYFERISQAKLTLNQLTLDGVVFKSHILKTEKFFQACIKTLIIDSGVQKLEWFKADSPIPLNCLKGIPCLDLRFCKINKASEPRITPIDLTLIDVKIVMKNHFLIENTKTNLVNKIVRFSEMRRMWLEGMRLDMSEKGFCVKELHYYDNDSGLLKIGTKTNETVKPIDGSSESLTHSKNHILHRTESVLNNSSNAHQNLPQINDLILVDCPQFPAIDLIVEPNETKETLLQDFPISELGALKIAKILQDYPNLKEEWTLGVPLSLGLSGVAIGKLSELKCGFASIVYQTIDLWRTENGKNIMFNNFIKVLDEVTRNQLALEDLLENREAIRLAGKLS